MTWLAAIAAVNMAVGLFYYELVAAEVYFEPSLTPPHRVSGGLGYASGLVVSVAGTIILGIMPSLVVPASEAAKLLR